MSKNAGYKVTSSQWAYGLEKENNCVGGVWLWKDVDSWISGTIYVK